MRGGGGWEGGGGGGSCWCRGEGEFEAVEFEKGEKCL